VLEGEHQLVGSAEPERSVILFERWSGYVDAEDPHDAEHRADQVYRYGGIPEPIRAGDLQPATFCWTRTAPPRPLPSGKRSGDQVFILLAGEVRATAYPATRIVMAVAVESV
jgi:hypothetical protein